MNHVGKETVENFYGTGERDVDICDRFEFTHDSGRSPYISRRVRSRSSIFSFPSGRT